MRIQALKNIVLASLTVMSGCLLAGCDDDDFDHDPPSGMGCIIVNNRTANDTYVYINGSETNQVDDMDDRYYDLNPGVYRVVLDERHGSQNYRGDVDVIKGKRTIMDVSAGWGDSYDVYIYFD